jgi:probable biosynthetic protein (TIGR04098 family)
MHRYGVDWHLGMPHTISRAVAEVALLAHVQDLHWKELGRLTGCPASRQRDADGHEVYASVFFVDLDAPTDRGLAAFGPDDRLAMQGALGRYGASILDGTHRATSADAPTADAIAVRMSFVLVALGSGPDDLRVATPVNAPIDRIPSLQREPDSYRTVRVAREEGTLGWLSEEAVATGRAPFIQSYGIDPDRDLNGVGLLYFANYVAFLDAAERDALLAVERTPPARRVTVRRRIAYYGNARSSDRLQVSVDLQPLDGPRGQRLLVRHSVHRESDGRLIALASAERLRLPDAS